MPRLVLSLAALGPLLALACRQPPDSSTAPAAASAHPAGLASSQTASWLASAPSSPTPAAAPPACDALFPTRQPPPADPSDLLYYVSRVGEVPPSYPVSPTSEWTPCEPGAPGASHDLLCLPAAYVQEGRASLRAVAFESDAPASPTLTHDGLAVGHLGKVGFRALFDAARVEAGLELFVRSGFRSYTSQMVTFRGWLAYERKQGLSYQRALRRVGTYSAREGHSEHQLGTTVDLTFRTPEGPIYRVWDPETMAASEAFRWVQANAHRFGIVLTYPRDRTHITQYRWEPWHYRFVGVEAADTMARCGLTTEEYLRARFDLPPAADYPDHTLLAPRAEAPGRPRTTALRGAPRPSPRVP